MKIAVIVGVALALFAASAGAEPVRWSMPQAAGPRTYASISAETDSGLPSPARNVNGFGRNMPLHIHGRAIDGGKSTWTSDAPSLPPVSAGNDIALHFGPVAGDTIDSASLKSALSGSSNRRWDVARSGLNGLELNDVNYPHESAQATQRFPNLKMSPFSTMSDQRGVLISLSLVHPAYPRGTLANTRITVRNLRANAITYAGPVSSTRAARTEVLRNGRKSIDSDAMYQPASISGVDGALGKIQMIQPRQTVVFHSVVVLQTGYLRPVFNSSVGRVIGDIVPIRLTRAPARPQIRLRESDDTLSATVVPRVRHTGPLLYRSWQRCTSSLPAAHSESGHRHSVAVTITSGTAGGWLTTDRATVKTQLPNSCLYDKEWHVVAGWIGHPIARLDYVVKSSH